MVSAMAPATRNIDSLLRFFQSEYFRSEIFYLMHYLYHDERPGVQDYLVNQLYEKPDHEVDFYLCQLVQICVARQCLQYYASGDAAENSKKARVGESLAKFLIWKAKRSVHFALKIHWLATSVFEEKEQSREIKMAGDRLIDQVERAVVNAHTKLASVAQGLTYNGSPNLQSASAKENSQPQSNGSTPSRASLIEPTAGSILMYLRSLRKETRGSYFNLDESCPNVYAENQLGDSIPRIEEQQKILTVNYWNTQLAFSTFLLSLTEHVQANEDRDSRLQTLQYPLNLLNVWLLERRCFAAATIREFQIIGLHLPLHGWDTRLQLLRAHVAECKVFSTKTRAPFLLVCEFADLDEAVPADEEEEATGSKKMITGRNFVQKEICTVLKETHVPSETLGDVLQRVTLKDWVSNIYTPYEDDTDIDYVSDNEKDEFYDEIGDDIYDSDVNHNDASIISLKEGAFRDSVTLKGSPKEKDASRKKEDSTQTNGSVAVSGDKKEDSSGKCLELQVEEGGSSATGDDPQPLPSSSVAKAQAGGSSSSTSQAEDHYCNQKAKRQAEAAEARKQIFGEPWENKIQRIKRKSSYSRLPSWCLRSIIVKSGDDVRQEVLAAQLITQFKWIFEQAPGINLYLRPIEVLITGARSGFIEMVPDSISIDRLKRKYPEKTMSQIFQMTFGDRLLTAKKNFTESTAAYSLICYFLQVRDRHNANMLLDREGHIVHIDFGFMLSNSPGNIAFETSPFKLTQELLDIMDGEQSEQYQYFCTLLIRGFLEARRHVERISTIIQMQMLNSNLPCFSGKSCATILQELEERFLRGVPDDVCIEHVHQLIDSSVNNWRTRQYDNYQRITNGIL